METKLPDLPHELIRVALRDLEACENTPSVYKINMETWHSPKSDGFCHVCLAGAVMAQSLGVSRYVGCCPSELHVPQVRAKLGSLNCFRMGNYDLGVHYLKEKSTHDNPHKPLYEYMWKVTSRLFHLSGRAGKFRFTYLEDCDCEDWDAYEVNPTKFREELNRMADMFERIYNSYQRKVKNNGTRISQ